jgi:hypothetical protein
MPITIFDVKRVPRHRRERIEAAVVAGGKHVSESYEVWIAADPFKGGFRLLITVSHGFEPTLALAVDDDVAMIAERVRETLAD